ncbi:MAG TPA: hypothetical protein DC054_09260 [Blastocatellia bacterium]|nr:hypothetical protein [Blastocatellia bacterium]
MKPFILANPVFAKWSRLLLVLALLELLSMHPGCNLSANPSKSVEKLCRTVERGELDGAATFFSSRLINKLGIEAVKEDLSRTTMELKEHGGIKTIKVLKEDVIGDVAEVTIEITRGNGNTSSVYYKLIKEQGVWKVDGVSADSEPLHPETAVEDVVKWAHENGATSIKTWLQKQPAPPICEAPEVDRATLPDEVRYHDVDDPKAIERLLTALDPVLTLVGCSKVRGLVLYKGQNVYAGNLDRGQIAITPGDSYSTGSPPDESIFHSLAELRIFLAREIFRPMVPVDKPSEGLNEADMILRRDLKLNYLAGLVSLAIDKDPAILDGVALDIASYAKPVGIVSGMQGTPSLQQLKDVFGAATQDYRK